MKEILVATVVVLSVVCGSSAQADFTVTATSNDLVINTVNLTASGNDALSAMHLTLSQDLGGLETVQTGPDSVYHFDNLGMVIQRNSSVTFYVSVLVSPNREGSVLTVGLVGPDAVQGFSAVTGLTITSGDQIAISNGQTIIPEPATLSILAIGAIVCFGRNRRKKAV